jgi:hypothetical protein
VGEIVQILAWAKFGVEVVSDPVGNRGGDEIFQVSPYLYKMKRVLALE